MFPLSTKPHPRSSHKQAITAVVATTVATAISSSAATSTMVAIGGKALAQISKTASNTGGGAITKLIAFGQLFALSALIQAPGLTDEYKKIAQSTDFLVLKIWRPWAKSTNNNVTVITSSCSNRRLLYADMDTSDGVVHHVSLPPLKCFGVYSLLFGGSLSIDSNGFT